MKLRIKSILSGALAIGFALSLSTVAFAEEQVSAFDDVPTDHWAHSAIMSMTAKGLFSGKGEIIDGVGRFAPEDIMSRAEFVTVVIRALYGEELTAMPKSEGAWYQNAQTIALQNGILNSNELDRGNLSKPMTRQEMAMVLVRAAEKNGETPKQLVDTSRIADYKTVGSHYQDYVVQAYSMGMISGKDNKGTFDPIGTLNRAQAAKVLYNLVETSERAEVDFNATVTPPTVETPAGQGTSWVEGEAHYSEPKVGDTVIKADGTKVVLKETFGLLGWGQGVDIYTGWTFDNGAVVRVGIASDFDQTPFIKSNLNNEMYSSQQWKAVKRQIRPAGLTGSYDGEIHNIYYQWNASLVEWEWIGPNVR